MKLLGTTDAEKRRDKRLTGRPLDVAFDGQRYTVAEWSIGGFLIDTYDGGREAGEMLPATVHVDTSDANAACPVTIEITRINASEHGIAARFVNLDGDAYDIFERWVSGRTPRRTG
ncbi:MAG: hypothetical protein VW644_14100 [Alphaproteobacteria bacterium]|jgi:hypothetical protein